MKERKIKNGKEEKEKRSNCGMRYVLNCESNPGFQCAKSLCLIYV